MSSYVPRYNEQLERTVIQQRVRAASAPFHMHTRRAGHVVVRPLNCGVSRQRRKQSPEIWRSGLHGERELDATDQFRLESLLAEQLRAAPLSSHASGGGNSHGPNKN
jgi:hypothetical protein